MSPRPAVAAGRYDDYARSAAFVIAPQALALDVWAARSSAPGTEAAIYAAAPSMPFRRFLFRLEFPYVSVTSAAEVRNDFGDPVLRARLRMWSGATRAVYLVSSVRMGSLPFLTPDRPIFPYATASLDFGAGVAYVDTVASMAWWLSGSATLATQVEEALSEQGLYGDHSEVGAGVAVAGAGPVRILFGAAAYFPAGGPTRQSYFCLFDWIHSKITTLSVSAQVEGGPAEERVTDYSIGVGTRLVF